MFIGHFGAGYAAKAADKKVSLGTLILASQFIDLMWPILVLFGIEKVKIEPGNTAFTPLNFIQYPLSHSLLAVAVWGILFGTIYYIIKKDKKGSILLGLLVLSHWVLDLFVHRPDLPLLPWSDIKAGFGLWNSVLFTLIIEGAVFITGIFIFIKTVKRKERGFKLKFWALNIFLALIYIMSIAGPVPNSDRDIAFAGLAMWLFVIWGYWIDKKIIKADE